jgi:predicted nucleic acid-binding protein
MVEQPAALVVDTSALYAFFNSASADHGSVCAVIDGHDGPLLLSPFVAAELDYLVATRMGTVAELAVLEQLGSGAFDLPVVVAEDVVRMRGVVQRYADMRIGLTDASLVVIADRYSTTQILTLDRRHFTALRPLAAEAFTLLP